MPDDEERAIRALFRGDRNPIVRAIGSGREVARRCEQVTWGHLHKLGFELKLRILLAGYSPILFDRLDFGVSRAMEVSQVSDTIPLRSHMTHILLVDPNYPSWSRQRSIALILAAIIAR